MMTKQETAVTVLAAKARLSWQYLADLLGTPLAWTTAALLGQHPLSQDHAKTAARALERVGSPER